MDRCSPEPAHAARKQQRYLVPELDRYGLHPGASRTLASTLLPIARAGLALAKAMVSVAAVEVIKRSKGSLNRPKDQDHLAAIARWEQVLALLPSSTTKEKS